MPALDREQKYLSIYRKILSVHRKLQLQLMINAAVFLITTTAVIFGCLVCIHLLFDVSAFTRILFLSLYLAWLLAIVIVKICPVVREIIIPTQPGLFRSAKNIGRHQESLNDSILNYLQLSGDLGSPGSEIIKTLALEQLYRRISPHPLGNKIPGKSHKHSLRILLASLAVLTIFFGFFPDPVFMAIKKTVFPWKSFTVPFPVSVINESGDVQVLKNDPVTLVASSEGIKPDRMSLVIEEINSGKVSDGQKRVNRINLEITGEPEYKYHLPHVSYPFRYYFSAEVNQPRFRERQAMSPAAQVLVRERPLIRSLQAKVTPPVYTGLEPTQMPPNDGEMTALPGSKIELMIESDKQLSSAQLVFADSTRLSFSVAGHTARIGFPVYTPTTYFIRITDTDSISNDDPVNYGIYILEDEYPYAEFKQPGADVDLQDELNLSVLLELRDDFGFSALWIKGAVYRQGMTEDSTGFQMEIPYSPWESGRAVSSFVWDLHSFYLVPDDYIRYYAEVFDNDRVGGPKSFKTGEFTLRLPSLLEILTRMEERQEEQLDKLEEVSRESRNLKEKLSEINRELKKETDVSWEQQQEIKKQLSRHQEIGEKLADIQKEVESLIKDMEEREGLSPEALQKYMELQKMFQELATPELKQAMEQLQKSLEKMDFSQIQKSLERMQFSLEQFEKNIERMYELFKRVELEQRMDDLVKLAEKLSQEQEQVNNRLDGEDIAPEDFPNLANMEQNIGKTLEFLSEKLEETRKDFQDLMQEPSRYLDSARTYIDEKNLPELVNNLRKQLSRQQATSCRSMGRVAKSNFDMLQNIFQTARQDMIQQQKMEITQEMRKVMQDMLSTSFDQERLARRSADLSTASPQITDVARQQSRVMGNTHQMIRELVEIGNKTFVLTPQLNQNMAEVLSSIGQAIEQLENRNPKQAAQHQKNAMSGLNRALLSMQQSMEQMAQSSSSTGFQEFMQQMQQISGQQGQLNQESMSMFQSSEEGRLQLSSNDMARLAAQQEMIRNSLDNLSDQMGERRDVLGRLNDLGNEMEEVVKELKSNRMDRKVIERQERILSRMLDAQKSIREKEHSRKREAEREEVRLVKSPPELRKEWLNQEDHFRKQLMDALEEGYSLEYREFIKYYFEILSRQSPIFQ